MCVEGRKSYGQASVPDVPAHTDVRTSAIVLEKRILPVLKGHISCDRSQSGRARGAYTRIKSDVVTAITNIYWKIRGAVDVLIPADATEVGAKAPRRPQVVHRQPLTGSARANRASNDFAAICVSLNDAGAHVPGLLRQIPKCSALLHLRYLGLQAKCPPPPGGAPPLESEGVSLSVVRSGEELAQVQAQLGPRPLGVNLESIRGSYPARKKRKELVLPNLSGGSWGVAFPVPAVRDKTSNQRHGTWPQPVAVE